MTQYLTMNLVLSTYSSPCFDVLKLSVLLKKQKTNSGSGFGIEIGRSQVLADKPIMVLIDKTL